MYTTTYNGLRICCEAQSSIFEKNFLSASRQRTFRGRVKGGVFAWEVRLYVMFEMRGVCSGNFGQAGGVVGNVEKLLRDQTHATNKGEVCE